MKHRVLTQCISLLLIAFMLLSVVSCGNHEETPSTEGTKPSELLTEENTRFVPDIERKQYDSDFNVVMVGWNTDLYIPNLEAERVQGGIGDAVYERYMMIKDHVGVDMKLADAGSWVEYASNIKRTVATGDDAYQLVMTHVYKGVSELVVNNSLMDMAGLPSIHLDADYWNTTLMDSLRIDGKYLLGHNDFCLSSTHCVVFNKDMMDRYDMQAPYDLVHNRQWTIDKLFEMASVVCSDNGDGKMDWQDTYGMTGWGWIHLISFVTSSGLKIVDANEDGLYHIAYGDNEERMLSVLDKVKQMYHAEYSYMWPAVCPPEETIPFASGRALFQLYSSTGLSKLASEDIRFGVLPYPMYDTMQDSYKSLSWSGVMGVPCIVKNQQMVSDVLELMAYYTAPVTTAYYEVLLGARIAEAPEDAAMLEIIWDSQVSDVGLVFCDSSQAMDNLVYMVPKICSDSKQNFASFMKANQRAAQKGLDKIFKS